MANASARASVYERITADILAAIERGQASGACPGTTMARPPIGP